MTAPLPARDELRVLAASPAQIALGVALGLDYAFLRALWGERRRPPAKGCAP